MAKKKKERETISEELSAKVMFNSDRTCCVCRTPGRKVQIHHIDGDPSNNAYENLAVACFDCHSDSHTTHAFARNLSAIQLRMYNESWRRLVKLRIDAPETTHDLQEYREEVLLGIGLLPIQWVNAMTIVAGGSDNDWVEPHRTDFWEPLIKRFEEKGYPLSIFGRFKELFTTRTEEMMEKFKELQLLHGDIIPMAVKSEIIRLKRSVVLAQLMYVQLPVHAKQFTHPKVVESVFNNAFIKMLEALRLFSERFNEITKWNPERVKDMWSKKTPKA